MEKKMEHEMETRACTGVFIRVLHRGYIGIVEKNMDATI